MGWGREGLGEQEEQEKVTDSTSEQLKTENRKRAATTTQTQSASRCQEVRQTRREKVWARNKNKNKKHQTDNNAPKGHVHTTTTGQVERVQCHLQTAAQRTRHGHKFKGIDSDGRWHCVTHRTKPTRPEATWTGECEGTSAPGSMARQLTERPAHRRAPLAPQHCASSSST